ncbi:pentatricopeptide (PPR) repeat-containing protein [Wolffia australiana]
MAPASLAAAARRRSAAADPRALHARLLRNRDPASPSDPFAANCAADAYAKSGHLRHALHLLDQIPHPNSISWNLRLSALNRLRRFHDSLRAFSLMRAAASAQPTEITFAVALSAAAAGGAAAFALQLHALAVKTAFSRSPHVATGLIAVLSKLRRLRDAVALFSESPPDVAVWNAAIAGAARTGDHRLALSLYLNRAGGAAAANEFTLSAVLAACAGAGELGLGRAVHARSIKAGFAADVVVGGATLDLYAKCGGAAAAYAQFRDMPARNVVAWTTLISAEEPRRAVEIFRAMRADPASAAEVNVFTVTAVLAACHGAAMAAPLAQLHSFLAKSGFLSRPAAESALITAYAKSAAVPTAEKLFSAGVRGPASWAAIISARGKARHESAFRALRDMLRAGLLPDEVCCCGALAAPPPSAAAQAHALCVKTGLAGFVRVSSAVFTAYSKSGSLAEAEALFGEIADKDEVAWTSMLAGLSQHGLPDRALALFRAMGSDALDPTALSHLLTACSSPSRSSLVPGREAHGKALRLGLHAQPQVLSSLLSLYFNHLLPRRAARAFAMAGSEKESSVWAVMVGGLARNGLAREALATFRAMVGGGAAGDCFGCSAAISAAAELAAEAAGAAVHAHAVKSGAVGDVAVATALVDLYASCGSATRARRAFAEAREADDVAWTALIEGYAKNGMAAEAAAALGEMKAAGGTPDGMTYGSVLAACARGGRVEEGLAAWAEMGAAAAAEQRAGVVDLLGRAGRLAEAAEVVAAAGAVAGAAEWAALMAACRAHGAAEMGRAAAEKVIQLDRRDGGAYVAMAAMAAESGDWAAAQRVRTRMRLAGAAKDPGWSVLA